MLLLRNPWKNVSVFSLNSSVALCETVVFVCMEVLNERRKSSNGLTLLIPGWGNYFVTDNNNSKNKEGDVAKEEMDNKKE